MVAKLYTECLSATLYRQNDKAAIKDADEVLQQTMHFQYVNIDLVTGKPDFIVYQFETRLKR